MPSVTGAVPDSGVFAGATGAVDALGGVADRAGAPDIVFRTQAHKPPPPPRPREPPSLSPQPNPRPRRRASPVHVLVGVVFGVGAILGLWTARLSTAERADAVLGPAAELAGLISGFGLLVLVVLMARIPAIEHGIGADVLARWHARAGRVVIATLIAHAFLAWCSHIRGTGTEPLRAAVHFLGHPTLAAATVGTGLLVLAAGMSVRAIRTRVRHETWRGLHLLTYVGVAAGFVHQPAGPSLVGAPVVTWCWTLAHIQVAALVVWFRGIVPLRAALRHDFRVDRVVDEGPGVVSVVIRGRELAALNAEPGQFFRWRFLTGRLWRSSLPFSLSEPVRGNSIRITVRVVGDHTRRIRRLRPGVRVLAAGPFGAMTAHRRSQRKVALIAGGAGITPMRALFETLPAAAGDLTLIYRARGTDDLLLRDELERIAVERGAIVHYLLGASQGHEDPLTAANLRRLLPDIAEHDVYVCGSPGMAAATQRALRRSGVPPERVHAEVFAW